MRFIKKLKIALIGCGRWAEEVYLPFFFNENNLTELTAVSFPPTDKKAHFLREKYQIPHYYADYKMMIKKEPLDAVVITSPHKYHFLQIKNCLQKNLHVLCDKPPALRSEDVRFLIKLKKSKKLIVTIFSQRRFWSEYLFLKKAYQENVLGKIYSVRGLFGQEIFLDFWNSWRANPLLCGGGILIDSGYHLIDSLLFIFQPVRPQEIIMFACKAGLKSDSFSTIILKMNNKTIINLNIARGLPKGIAEESLQIIGENGMIILSRNKILGKRKVNLVYYDKNGNLIKRFSSRSLFKKNVLPINNFLNAIIYKKPDLSSLEDSYYTVKTIEAAYLSWKRKSIIKI